MKKILLDSDIGSDIDDAIALAYLLKQKQCGLLGITTVSGDSINRAKLASAICLAGGRGDVPIYPGTEAPLLVPQKQPVAKQAKWLDKWEHAKEFPMGQAVEFMRRTIRENPGEVTLLAIGPMTNVALLFALDPEIPAMLKELVLMCGVFQFKTPLYIALAEWNSRCDPHASAMIYKAPVKRIRSIGLDVTAHCTMQKSVLKDHFTANVLKPVLEFSGALADEGGFVTYHDPLAAATIFDDRICRFETGDIDVIAEGKYVEGLTFFTPNLGGNQDVALEVDSHRFFMHYFETVNNS